MLANKRSNGIKKTAIAIFFARLVTIICQLAMVPLTLPYLGNDKYGLWMTIASLIGFLQLTDLGLSNSIIGYIAEKRAKHQDCLIVETLKKVFLLILTVSACVFLLGCFITISFDFHSFLNVAESIDRTELNSSLLIFLGVFCINLPLSIAQQTRLGMQLGHQNAVYNSIGQILNLFFVFLVIHFQENLFWLIFASMLGSILANMANLFFLWVGLKGKEKKPKEGQFENDFSILLKRSFGFFILQLSSIVSYQSDLLIVSHYLTNQRVAEYSIALKYFNFPGIILSFFFVGMWPAYSDALSRKDYSWLIYFFKKSLKLSLWLIFSFSFILYLISPFAIEKWTRGKIIMSSNLLTGMFFWCILSSIGGSFSTLLNGLHKLKFQISIGIFGSIFNISLSIFLVKKIGISGPIWGSVITLLLMYSATWYFIVVTLKDYQKERVECNEDSL